MLWMPQQHPMEKTPDYPNSVKVSLDWCVVNGLDKWREHCPTINRSALVNQIILEWLRSKNQ
jgi:hypothetical protein